MKKSLIIVLLVLISILMTVCGTACNKSSYPLKYGAYNFEHATITNRLTKEVMEKDFDDILNDKSDFKDWGNLFSFQIFIDKDTEYFYKSDKRCFVLNEGIAFEVIAENTLKLHFPYWSGYDYNNYDIVIILGWQQVYG